MKFAVLLLTLCANPAACMQRNFRVVGGGLAGLGVTYHLLRGAKQPIRIQVVDQSRIGQGGASAVAGGYVPTASVSYGVSRISSIIFATLDQACIRL